MCWASYQRPQLPHSRDPFSGYKEGHAIYRVYSSAIVRIDFMKAKLYIASPVVKL